MVDKGTLFWAHQSSIFFFLIPEFSGFADLGREGIHGSKLWEQKPARIEFPHL